MVNSDCENRESRKSHLTNLKIHQKKSAPKDFSLMGGNVLCPSKSRVEISATL